MKNREAQNDLCRSTKTPEEVYKIALSYKRGNKYAKSYVSASTGGTISSLGTAGKAIQTKTESVGAIRGIPERSPAGQRHIPRARSNRGVTLTINRCYSCDQPNFTREHMERCPAKRVTFCRKEGHYERSCKGKRGNQRGRGAVGLIQEHDSQELDDPQETDDLVSQHGSSIGWVNLSEPLAHSCDSYSSRDYMVRAVRHKRKTELKIAGAQLPIRINGKPFESG